MCRLDKNVDVTRIQITYQVMNKYIAPLTNSILWIMVRMIKKGEMVLVMDFKLD
jgi:hypothetical protein